MSSHLFAKLAIQITRPRGGRSVSEVGEKRPPTRCNLRLVLAKSMLCSLPELLQTAGHVNLIRSFRRNDLKLANAHSTRKMGPVTRFFLLNNRTILKGLRERQMKAREHSPEAFVFRFRPRMPVTHRLLSL